MEFNIGTGVFKRDSVFLCSCLSNGTQVQWTNIVSFFDDQMILGPYCFGVSVYQSTVQPLATFGKYTNYSCHPSDVYLWADIVR